MKYLFILLLLASCAHEPKIIYIEVEVEKKVFVDYQTYLDWGTTKLIPIGRRPVPTQREFCLNPSWINSKGCEYFHAK